MVMTRTPACNLPILWRTDYQEPADTAALMQCMRKHLVRDQRWLDLRREQADDVGYRPGAIVFSPGRVSGAMAYRHWEGSLQRDNITTIGIMDAEGHVVRQMGPPTASWNALKPPAFTGRVGDIEGVVAGLKTGAYAAVNGRCEWRVFRSMDRAPSVLKEHISASARVNPKIAKDLLKPMEEAGVITSWRGGHYLSEAGRALVTASQGALQSRVDKRLDVYDRPESKHRSRNRIHNEGQAYALMYLDDHGHVAFPALGSVIEYIVDGRRLRVDPDGYVVLEPGVLVALEFERSSLSKDQILEKIGKPKPDLRRVGAVRYGGYKGLADFGRPVPGLVITETDEAARRVAELRCPYILAASLDAVRRGPHGRAVTDSVADASPGCWWYWRPGEARPSNDAPIDLLSRMYVRDYPQGVWRLPFDRPFAAEPIQHTGG